MTSGGRPTRREAERRLERVLAIARRRFLAEGYSETSLETIARDSGIAKKTLYHHFGSKAGLFAAILESLRQSWIAELRDMTVRPVQPERVLEAVALHLLDVGTRPEMVALHRLITTEAQRFPELVQRHYDRSSPRGMEPLHDYLRAAVGAGRLRLDDVGLAAEQFSHLVLGRRAHPAAARRDPAAQPLRAPRHRPPGGRYLSQGLRCGRLAIVRGPRLLGEFAQRIRPRRRQPLRQQRREPHVSG